jgi:hypothetical protein
LTETIHPLFSPTFFLFLLISKCLKEKEFFSEPSAASSPSKPNFFVGKTTLISCEVFVTEKNFFLFHLSLLVFFLLT